jgi:hypothetical protein
LQERPILKARQTIVKSLDDPEQAKWYLERKRKNEFSTKSEVESKSEIQVSGDVEVKTCSEDIIDEVLTKLKQKKFNEQKGVNK